MGRKRTHRGLAEASPSEQNKTAFRQPFNEPTPPSTSAGQGPWRGEPCWPMASVLFVLVLVCYVETMPPSIVGGDNSELVNAACVLGVPHPPGYPLLTLLGSLVGRMGGKESIAWRLNIFNAVLGATSSVVVFLAARMRHLGGGDLGAGVAALAFGLHPIQWQYHTHFEVFALNNLLVALVILLAVVFVCAPPGHASLGVACAGAFVCGLGISNQHTITLFVVPIAIRVLWRLLSEGKLTPRSLLLLALSAVAGLLPYGYLPLASSRHPSGSWGDQTNVEGFLKHFLRKEYGTFRLYGGFEKLGAGQTFLQGIGLHLRDVVKTSGYVGALFPLMGALLGAPMALQTRLLALWTRLCSALTCFGGRNRAHHSLHASGTGSKGAGDSSFSSGTARQTLQAPGGGREPGGTDKEQRHGPSGSGTRKPERWRSDGASRGRDSTAAGAGLFSYLFRFGAEQGGEGQGGEEERAGVIRARLANGDVRAQVASVRLLLLLFVTYNGVFHFLSNVPLDKHLLLGVQKRFWMQSNVLVALLAAAGISAFQKLCTGAGSCPDAGDADSGQNASSKVGSVDAGSKQGQGHDDVCNAGTNEDEARPTTVGSGRDGRGSDGGGVGVNGGGPGVAGVAAARTAPRKGGRAAAVEWAIVLAVAGVLAGARIPVMRDRDNWHMWRYGRSHLDALPRNAMLIVWGDIQQFTLGYHQRCQGYRTDVRLFDLAMGSYIWYKPMQLPNLPGVVIPGRMYHPINELDFNVKQLIDANIDARPVFMLQWFQKDNSAYAHYDLVPTGMVQRVVPKGANATLDYAAWLRDSAAAAIDLDALPAWNRYDRSSWEHVLSTEVCNMHFEWAKFALSHLAHAPTELRLEIVTRAIASLAHPRVYLWWDYRPSLAHMLLGFAYQQRYNNFKEENDKENMLEYYRRFMIEAPADHENRGQVAAVLQYYGKPVPTKAMM